MTLVLASASAARRRLLAAAGIAVLVDPAMVDEARIKAASWREGRSCEDCAVALAEAKAEVVSARHPGALVIGADQMLDHDGTWLDKPRDREHAQRQLMSLRGRRHELVSAVALALDDVLLWHHVERAGLAMRDFSDAFLDDYLAAMGERVLATVGGYEFEGLGAQLFAGIEGDYFAILGLPLLPLLEALRQRGALAA
jgi:septum formation protein